MLRKLTIFLSALTFAGYAAPYFDPYAFWPLAFLGLSYPFFAAANLLLLALWLLRKQKVWALLPFFTLIAGGAYFNGFIGLRAFGEKASDESSLRIVSYNVRRFQPYGQPFGFVISEADWRQELKALQADILMVQEFEAVSALPASALAAEYGLIHQAKRKGEDLVVFSRYPVLRTEAILFNRIYGFRYADIDVRGQTLRVYNFHLQSNAITGIAERVAENADLKEKRTWLEIKGMLGRYRRAARIRQEQARHIAAHVRQSPYPVVLCGDLNDVPQSHVYYLMSTGLQDAFLRRGSGWGVTYAGRLPGLRIDVILGDDALRFLRCKTGETGFSDHRPVIADLALPFQ